MEISVTVERFLTPQFVSFSAHTFESSCDHLIVERVHFRADRQG